jgi:ketosteroid isomerase-like protein
MIHLATVAKGESMRPLTVTKAIIALVAFFVSSLSVHAQTADLAADKSAVDKVLHDYFEAYSRGDMAAVMKFINTPFMVQSPKGFTAFTTVDEELAWYTKFRDAAVKQGYAKTEWIDLSVKLLGQSYAIAAGSYVRYKTDGSELNRSGGTYLLNKVDGVWKIGVNMGYPVNDAFKLE